MGRPSDFTEELAKEICLRLAQGESLRSICREEGTPAISTVMRWVADRPAFQEQYARARQQQAEYWAEQIIEIADDDSRDTIETEDGEKQNTEWINRSRLRVDTRKWLMSKLLPKKYGDKLDVAHTGNVTINTVRYDPDHNPS